jgi:peptidoglycan/xylan/chitin deacetylase (PgdA/CDA1 family)
MYHYIRDLKNSRYPQIKGLDTAYFKQQLDFLETNYQIIGVLDMFSLPPHPPPPPHDDDRKPRILLTFDDGYIDHYTTVFPLLAERGLSGFFSMPGKIIKEGKVLDVNKIHFLLASIDVVKLKDKIFNLLDYYRGREFEIPENDDLYAELAVDDRFDNKDIVFTKRLLQHKLDEDLRNLITDDLFREFIPVSEQAFSKELYMNMAQVKLMKKYGMYFGIHGYDHYWLGLLDAASMKKDIAMALDVFDEVIDRNNWVMCYPYGSYNDETLEYLKKTKCSFGFTTEVAVAQLPGDRCLELPRLDTNDFPPKSENYKTII